MGFLPMCDEGILPSCLAGVRILFEVNGMDIGQVINEIEDYVVPRLKLDVGEARLYYHLLRHSRFMNKNDVLISVAKIAEVLNSSMNTVKTRLRMLQDKKVIAVTSTGWVGTRIKVSLPREISDAVPEKTDPPDLDIECIDFYKDSKFRSAILERDQGRCFYCRRELSDGESGLDHADPQKTKGTNSYRNVVAACHHCNSSKGDDTAEEFLRKLYKKRFLSADELDARLVDVTKLKQGLLRPTV